MTVPYKVAKLLKFLVDNRTSRVDYILTNDDIELLRTVAEDVRTPELLAYKNTWNRDEWTINGKPVKSLKSVIIGDKLMDVTSRNVTIPYEDHGHSYTASSTHHFVVGEFLGVTVEMDLNRLAKECAILAVDWEV